MLFDMVLIAVLLSKT